MKIKLNFPENKKLSKYKKFFSRIFKQKYFHITNTNYKSKQGKNILRTSYRGFRKNYFSRKKKISQISVSQILLNIQLGFTYILSIILHQALGSIHLNLMLNFNCHRTSVLHIEVTYYGLSKTCLTPLVVIIYHVKMPRNEQKLHWNSHK